MMGVSTTQPSRRSRRCPSPPHGITAKDRSAVNAARAGETMSGHRSPRREEVLLAHELDQVGDRLEQAEGACAVRPVAKLHAAEELALEPASCRRT